MVEPGERLVGEDRGSTIASIDAQVALVCPGDAFQWVVAMAEVPDADIDGIDTIKIWARRRPPSLT
jgi:hypothetical protein